MLQDLLQKIRIALSDVYSESETRRIAYLVIEYVTGLTIPKILSDKSIKITSSQEAKIDQITKRLQRFEPIQYVLNETEFYGLPFRVSNHVLIPRPETEELVELVISDNKFKSPRILDIGTGSGAIAIVLKKYLSDSIINAWDISEKAIEIATENAKMNSVEVSFKIVDILSDFTTNSKFDIIVSNPPYVLDAEKKFMLSNVLDYEPHVALFVPDNNPILFYKRITDASISLFEESGLLYFEINQEKGDEIINYLQQKGFKNAQIIKDISGNDRIVKAEYTNNS